MNDNNNDDSILSFALDVGLTTLTMTRTITTILAITMTMTIITITLTITNHDTSDTNEKLQQGQQSQ